VRALLTSKPMHEIAVPVITQAELLYGVAKRQHPPSLTARVNAFLVRVSLLPCTEDAARVYGDLNARVESSGISLAPLDMMIAAHALSVDAVLVTADRALSRLPVGMTLENWTET